MLRRSMRAVMKNSHLYSRLQDQRRRENLIFFVVSALACDNLIICERLSEIS
jgi:hypothetical protein